MKKRAASILTALFALHATPAHAVEQSLTYARQLAEVCKDDSSERNHNFCMGYILGAMDGAEEAGIRIGKRLLTTLTAEDIMKIGPPMKEEIQAPCIKTGTQLEDIFHIIRAKLVFGTWDETANSAVVIHQLLAAAYPCEEQ